jgi:hypothetical protein
MRRRVEPLHAAEIQLVHFVLRRRSAGAILASYTRWATALTSCRTCRQGFGRESGLFLPTDLLAAHVYPVAVPKKSSGGVDCGGRRRRYRGRRFPRRSASTSPHDWGAFKRRKSNRPPRQPPAHARRRRFGSGTSVEVKHDIVQSEVVGSSFAIFLPPGPPKNTEDCKAIDVHQCSPRHDLFGATPGRMAKTRGVDPRNFTDASVARPRAGQRVAHGVKQQHALLSIR